MIGQTIALQGKEYRITELLGHGKSAWSWLAENGGGRVVYKKMHNEAVEHYTFSDKVLSEVDAWKKLSAAGIPLPVLLEWDAEKQYLVKEYIEGPTAAELCIQGKLTDEHFEMAWDLNSRLAGAGFHIDWFPTNFIFTGGGIVYIDYECHPYNAEWDFEHWGVYYWLNRSGMKEHLETGTCATLNKPGTPKPVTEPFEAEKQALKERLGRSNG